MTDEEYTEPTNEQLARFLVVQARSDPRTAGMNLNAVILETLLSNSPRYREAALRRHRQFQADLHEFGRRIAAGQMQCEHTLQSGKQCPNRNEPGNLYCGLHKEEHGEAESSGDDAQPDP